MVGLPYFRRWLAGLCLVGMLIFPGQAGDVQRFQPTPGPESAWHTLIPGIQYRQFYLPSPNRLYVARLERSRTNLTLESALAGGQLGQLQTVRQMVVQFDQAVTAWGGEWGSRSQIVVAINGGFFDKNSGWPLNGQVQGGWYLQRFNERENGSGFVWTLDRVAFIGGCVIHRPAKQQVELLRTQETLQFSQLNPAGGVQETAIFTPHAGTAIPLGEEAVGLLVSLNRPLFILPSPAMITGTVQSILNGKREVPLLFDQILLVGRGAAGRALAEQVQPGDTLGISQEVTHFQPDCRTPAVHSWTNAYAAVGASFAFLREGRIMPANDVGALYLNPRTAVAFNEQYIFFIVVDGRDRVNSLGMSIVELALFARDWLGATEGVALDGGGSSTMVVGGQVVNNPNAELRQEQGAGGASEQGKIERAVANALMMVAVQPKEQSTRFRVGERVNLRQAASIYRGPGLNYAVLTQLPAGTPGTILPQAAGLDGVLAQGTAWWQVAFAEGIGWVREEDIQAAP